MPNFINSPDDIDIAINSGSFSPTGENITGAYTASNTVRKVVNLTVANNSATDTRDFIVKYAENGGQVKTTFIEGTLEPGQSVCLIDGNRPVYLQYNYALLGFYTAPPSHSNVKFYCATEVYS